MTASQSDSLEPVTLANRLAGGGYLLLPDTVFNDPGDAKWVPLSNDPVISAKLPDPTDVVPVMVKASPKTLKQLGSGQIKDLIVRALGMSP